MEKKIIYTRQHANALNILNKEGVFRVRPQWIQQKYGDISDHFLKSYDWLSAESAKRIPRPAGVSYPIWCNISEDYMLREVPGEVVFKLSIDADKILYFDSLKWDMILNEMYLPADPEDDAAFLEELARRGIANQFVLLSPSVARFHPDLVKRVRESWKRLFTIDDWDGMKVQANIWEFYPEDILALKE